MVNFIIMIMFNLIQFAVKLVIKLLTNIKVPLNHFVDLIIRAITIKATNIKAITIKVTTIKFVIILIIMVIAQDFIQFLILNIKVTTIWVKFVIINLIIIATTIRVIELFTKVKFIILVVIQLFNRFPPIIIASHFIATITNFIIARQAINFMVDLACQAIIKTITKLHIMTAILDNHLITKFIVKLDFSHLFIIITINLLSDLIIFILQALGILLPFHYFHLLNLVGFNTHYRHTLNLFIFSHCHSKNQDF